jgi:hypothetical protein
MSYPGQKVHQYSEVMPLTYFSL